jgi:NADPH-dependent 2,4-dienoyl-CoA reductase/sulfur reductase-like enzyme
MIEEKIQSVLEAKGVRIIKRAKLFEIEDDEDEGLEAVAFKLLDIPDEEEDEEEEAEAKSEG